MIKQNKWIEIFVETESGFESDLLRVMYQAYKLGAQQKYTELNICEDGDEFVKFEGTEKAQAIITRLTSAINNNLTQHNKEVAMRAIEKYKREHNIKD